MHIYFNLINLLSFSDKITVFIDKSEALKLVKKYKRARFKAFRTLKEATDFADYGAEAANNSWVSSPPPESINLGEKPSPFKGPKPQDFVRLRKSIENGELETVEKVVWENPRYLVSSGDTPAILQVISFCLATIFITILYIHFCFYFFLVLFALIFLHILLETYSELF